MDLWSEYLSLSFGFTQYLLDMISNKSSVMGIFHLKNGDENIYLVRLF